MLISILPHHLVLLSPGHFPSYILGLHLTCLHLYMYTLQARIHKWGRTHNFCSELYPLTLYFPSLPISPQISFFPFSWIIFHFVHISEFHYPVYWWTSSLVSLPGYHKIQQQWIYIIFKNFRFIHLSFFVCMIVLYAYVYGALCVPDAFWCQKTVSDPLSLDDNQLRATMCLLGSCARATNFS